MKLNPTEEFPTRLSFAYLPTGDTASLFTGLKGLPPLKLSSHSTDIIRGDGHRWYYAYSMAYLAHTRWSPILRDLLRLKRRSCRAYEKGEDGARAQMVEEYLTMIARRLPAANEEIDLLDEFSQATRTLEVRNVSREVWKRAITCGNELFHFLQKSSGAGITIDLEEGSLEWRPLSKASDTESHPNELKRKTPSPFRRATGKYSIYILETKPETVEVFTSLESGGLVNLGSKAEEWSIDPSDNFRWHDLFHLSFFAVCGWSVVCKTMLGLDDETVPRSGIMGIRGAIMEEAIISRFFTEISSGKNAVEAAEIAATSACILCKDTKLAGIKKISWKEALIRGHSLMTEAVKFGGGTLNIDLEAKLIEFLRN